MDSQKEKRIIEFYKENLKNALSGDAKEFLNGIANEAIAIGTTEGEWMQGKHAIKKKYNNIEDQLTGKVEMRNRDIKVVPIDQHFLILERSELFAKIEGGWNFVFKTRNSVLITEKEQHFKIVFQHMSVPDQASTKDESVPYKKLKEDYDKLEEAVKERTKKLEESLTQLKSTQTQLIQAEKMASLGELTAGIAHEIQNPLNFVNNFSDVSGEMIDEVIEEITSIDSAAFDSFDAKGLGRRLSAQSPQSPEFIKEKLNEAKDILGDLKGNLEKISHHGGRASSIVKGMLDHSRSSSNEKVPTDINVLCDEYLRLSYHGLRAKDNSFNSGFVTNFDDNIPLINVVPQDLGRVLLNILNNAFYTVDGKSKVIKDPSIPKDKPGYQDYKPTVVISTQLIGKQAQLTIKDNGSGIPEELLDKIFQPFFTTKPTGSGTGLGLSISYDIIKAHNGNLEVTSDQDGTIFTITLPINEDKKQS